MKLKMQKYKKMVVKKKMDTSRSPKKLDSPGRNPSKTVYTHMSGTEELLTRGSIAKKLFAQSNSTSSIRTCSSFEYGEDSSNLSKIKEVDLETLTVLDKKD